MFAGSRILAALGLLTLAVADSSASVVLNGTRVILSSQSNEKTLQFTNPDIDPKLVQVWVSSEDANSSLDNANPAFLLTPQVFKIEPNTGQVVRLKFLGRDLPKDRESIFYLNFSQIPSLTISSSEKNKLVLLFTNRLKLLYRPKEIEPTVSDAANRLEFKLKHNDREISLANPTGFYYTVRSAELIQDGHVQNFITDEMITPKSEKTWTLKSKPTKSKAYIKLITINDYGVDTLTEVKIVE